jgi:hypothetical protein
MGLTYRQGKSGTSPSPLKYKPMDSHKTSTVKKVLLCAEMAKEVRLGFYQSIEAWIGQELEVNAGNLTGLAILLSDEMLHLSRVDAKTLHQCPRLIEGVKAAFSYASKKFEELDEKLDQHHAEFHKDMEDLDFRVVREKEVFLHYLQDLAHSEEFYFISRKLKKVYETLREIQNAKD